MPKFIYSCWCCECCTCTLMGMLMPNRGALGSAGRTSWTARAERADYMSVAGFVAHYVHFLDPSGRPSSEDSTVSEENRAVQVQPPTLSSPAPILLLSGYSYGAMITTHLPPLDAILSLFLTPESGSPAAEIRLRAQHLAEMQSTVISSARDAASSHHLSPRAPRRGVGLRVGGDEENRKSQDSRRSLSMDLENSVRQDAADLLAKAARARRNREAPNKQAQEPTKRLPPVAGLTFRPAYLLVSPLQGIITNLATMSFPSPLSIGPGRLLSRWLPKLQEESSAEPNALSRSIPPGAEDKLTQNPTLAVYGDHDVFVSARKLREWATRLQTLENSHFHAIEVSGAGHFWAQSSKNARILQDMVQTFGLSLLNDAT